MRASDRTSLVLSHGSYASNGAVPFSLGARRNKASGPPEIVMGTGRFVSDTATSASSPGVIASGGDVTLDFVNVDVRDVARSVLGDLLKLTYAVDPALQTSVTLQTGRPIARTAVLPTLQSALQLSGIALVERDGVYRLVPIANAPREARLGVPGGAGFVTRVITPQYVAAAEIERVLQPLLPPGSVVRAEPGHNVLIVTGTQQDVADIMSDVATFDVDYLRGMSFALLPLQNAQAKDVAREVTTLLGASASGSAGVAKVVPIDRLNAVLVISMQPNYLDRVRAWVARLDRTSANGEQKLFVYRVQNGRAADLASVLRRAIGLEASSGARGGGANHQPPGAAPPAPMELQPSGPGATSPIVSASGQAQVPNILLGGLTPGPSQQRGEQAELNSGLGEAPMTGGAGNGIRLTADENNNAIVISASPQEYAMLDAALQKLDVLPLQVLIEATIAEITLTKQLNLGLQYFIKSGNFAAFLGSTVPGAAAATTTTTAATALTLATPFPGFGLVPGLTGGFVSPNGSSVILQALEQLTNVRVLSSPNLLVLNNQSARLQVGDEVPIATQSATSVITPGAPVVNSIDYRDTGVILNVTPRVNAGGLVLLDIAEEVSDVSQTTSSSLNSPTITQRRVTSSVAVNDGQTIALGGLIKDSRNSSRTGIPYLRSIPVLGSLFDSRSVTNARTELIVLITPHVVRGRNDADAITAELRQKLGLTASVLRFRAH